MKGITVCAAVPDKKSDEIMKLAVIIVRVLMGLLYLFASVFFLLNLVPQPELSGNTKIFMDGVNASGYLMPLVKITEFFCGIAFVTGFYVPLAAVIIAPITLNILLFHIFVDRTGLPAAIFLLLANLFVAYSYREKYKPLLEIK